MIVKPRQEIIKTEKYKGNINEQGYINERRMRGHVGGVRILLGMVLQVLAC